MRERNVEVDVVETGFRVEVRHVLVVGRFLVLRVVESSEILVEVGGSFGGVGVDGGDGVGDGRRTVSTLLGGGGGFGKRVLGFLDGVESVGFTFRSKDE